ncbi:hypothetical protein DFH06DRAFT_1169051 [Mycena polygramma]|nr:hypothetical protein DFH06DRAFT_1169051 [Mycena polygramma]
MSHRKDRVSVLCMHTAPPHLSKATFDSKVKGVMDSIQALPVFKENVLKLDLIFQNEVLTEHIKALGFAEARPCVWMALEFQTEEHFAELLKDAELKQLMSEAEDFGFCTGGCSFVADVVTKIDVPAPTNRAHLMGVCKLPDTLSTNEFHAKFEGLFAKLLALPLSQNILKHSLWVQNKILDSELRALGLAAPPPLFVLMIEAEVSAAPSQRIVLHSYNTTHDCPDEGSSNGGACSLSFFVAHLSNASR